MRPTLFAIVMAGAVAVGTATPARAGELDLAGGLGATTSAWDGDTGASSSLKVGYFFDRLPWLAPILLLRLEVVPVDNRLVEYFSAGAEARRGLGPVRGYARLGLIHCHESSRSAFSEQPLQAIFGVADGLRHRAGANLGIGIELPVKHVGASDLYLALDVSGSTFFDDRGPSWYASATLGLGYRWARGAAARPRAQVAHAR